MTERVDLGIDDLSDFEVIGTGGFSTVFSAWDEGFNRRVAVKLLHSLDEAGRRRFDRERGIMGQLSSHPNVITPFRAGYTGTRAPYLVMEFVEGGTLQDLVARQGRLPWTQAIDYIIPATEALGYAHDQGVLHRDVKPGNILLARSGPKLTDFGIAAIRESTASQVAYTLAHCPPETFAQGQDSRDHRSDLYSMASTLFTLLTGQPPFDVDGQDSQQAYMFRIIDRPVPEVPPELAPEPVRAFMRAALSKNPLERPQTAQAFADHLRHIRGTAATSDPVAPAPHEVIDLSRMAPPSGPPSGEGLPSYASAPTSFDPNPSGPSVLPHSDPTQADISIDPARNPITNRSSTNSVPTQHSDKGLATEHRFIGEPEPRRRGRWLFVAIGAVVAAALAVGGFLFLQASDGDDDGGAPDEAWRFETNSSLSSKPAVADGTLVIGAFQTDTVHAIDTETGLEQWSFETGGNVSAGPAIASSVVYIGAQDGVMYALDLSDGSEVWQTDVGDSIVGGAAVVDGRVVVGTEGGAIVGLDQDDGSIEWEAEGGAMINSTPAAAMRDGQSVVVVGVTDGGFHILDPEAGELIERIQLPAGVWFSKPLVVDRPDGAGQEVWMGTSAQNAGYLVRVDLESDDVAEFQVGGGVGTDPAITDDGLVIAGNDKGELFAVSQVTVGEIWRMGYADATQIKGSPAVYQDQIIFGTHDRELISVDHAGEELWRFEGEQIFGLSAPIVVGDLLFVGNDSGTVYRFDL